MSQVRALEPVPSPLAVRPLSDAELEDRLKRLAGVERKALSLLLAHLGEFDRRRLYADRGLPSLFAYCTTVLGYSEQAAFKRIQAARCPSTSSLEIDHIRPYALGGSSEDAANLRVLCRAHNQLLARRVFGDVAVPCREDPTR